MRKDLEVRTPHCPYCKNEAELVDSAEFYAGVSYGWTWLCRGCNARVSCHKGTKIPTGTLAKPDVMELRKECHQKFDVLWKSGKMTRKKAYKWLAKVMKLKKTHAHIGYMGKKQCLKFLIILNQIN